MQRQQTKGGTNLKSIGSEVKSHSLRPTGTRQRHKDILSKLSPSLAGSKPSPGSSVLQ